MVRRFGSAMIANDSMRSIYPEVHITVKSHPEPAFRSSAQAGRSSGLLAARWPVRLLVRPRYHGDPGAVIRCNPVAGRQGIAARRTRTMSGNRTSKEHYAPQLAHAERRDGDPGAIGTAVPGKRTLVEQAYAG